MPTIKDATLSLSIDASRAKQGAQQFAQATDQTAAAATRADKAVSGLDRAVKTAALALGGLISARILIHGAQQLIGLASAAEEVQSKFNVVFGQTTDAANRWSRDFGQAVGRSQLEIKRAMSGAQDLFVPLGFAREDALELSKAMTALAVDVASFSNAADADVMANFQSALVGNHEVVRKYGVIISEAALEQEAFRRGLNKSYKDLSDLQRVLLRLSLIQRGSTDAIGDAIRTGDSYANQQKRLKAALAETGVELGEVFLPAATKALQGVNALLREGRTAVKDWAADFKEGVSVVTGSIDQLDATVKKMDLKAEFQRFGPDTQKSIREAYRSRRPDDPFAFSTQRVTDPMGGSREVFQQPRDPDYAAKLIGSYGRAIDRRNAPPISSTGTDTLDKLLGGNDGASAYTGPGAQFPNPDDMKTYWSTSIDYMNQDIDTRKAAIGEMDRMESAVQRELDLIGLLPDSYERAAQAIEYAARANEIYGEGSEEARRKIAQFDKSLDRLARQKKLTDVAQDISRAFGQTFADLVTGAATAEDAFRSLGNQIVATMAQRMIADPITTAMMGAFGVMHHGGIVGQTASPTRYVDPSIFTFAPRLHGGLRSDEFPAILQRGEAVIPKGQVAASQSSAPNVSFNITNQSGAQVDVQQTGVQWDGRRMIVGMMMQDRRNNGPISRANRRR